MRKFFLLATFFVSAPFLFLASLLYYLFIAYSANPPEARYSNNLRSKSVAYAALPTNQNIFDETVVTEEARTEIIRQFFARYQSPLEPHAGDIVEAADKYNLDFRLLPAIAMQESNLCKKSRPESFNCWGFGIYGNKYLHFDSYEHAIETVTKTLATKYKSRGLITPEQIVTMYTPSDNGKWVNSVTYFMKELQ